MNKVKEKEISSEEKSLATNIPQEISYVNFDPAQQVEYAQKAAKALMTIIEATKPLTMQGKRYLYFEHWQTVARFFNTTVGIDGTTQTDKGYIAKAVVYDKNGVVIGGAEASCMKDEMNWKNKPDFQLRSMAQTRAMAKALRSIYGFVAVLAGVEATPAEEMSEHIVESKPVGQAQHVVQPTGKQPSEKQKMFIKKLCTEKQITQTQLKELAVTYKGDPSGLIEYLLNYRKQETQELPVIQQEMSEEDQKLVDSIPF